MMIDIPISRPCLIANTAAIKNVLSPISVISITTRHFQNDVTKSFDPPNTHPTDDATAASVDAPNSADPTTSVTFVISAITILIYKLYKMQSNNNNINNSNHIYTPNKTRNINKIP